MRLVPPTVRVVATCSAAAATLPEAFKLPLIATRGATMEIAPAAGPDPPVDSSSPPLTPPGAAAAPVVMATAPVVFPVLLPEPM